MTASVRMESVLPAQIQLTLEPRIERRLPIRSRILVLTENGYQVVGKHVLTPDSVSVSGATSIVENLDYWPTQSRTIENVTSARTVVIPLSDSLGSLVDVEIEETEYRVDVQRFTEASRQVEIRVDGAPA